MECTVSESNRASAAVQFRIVVVINETVQTVTLGEMLFDRQNEVSMLGLASLFFCWM